MSEIPGIFVYGFLFLALYFQVFLLVSFFDSRKRIRKEGGLTGQMSNYPSVTIIVPCWDEEKTLAKTMYSLFKLDYPKEKLNLIIVDDGSTDKTWSVARRFSARRGVTAIRKENGGKHTALNLALESVKTDLVGCLDADSFVFPDTLKKIVAYFEDSAVMAVTPAIKIHEPKTILEHIQNVEYNIGIYMRKVLGTLDAIQVTPGPFSIFRRQVFENLGPYKKAHGTEDLEIAFRMHNNHYRIINSHKAFVETVAPKTLKGLYKQRLRWVHGFLENALDYKHLFFNRRYGNFGMFMLPAAVISIFAALYLIGYGLWSGVVYLAGKMLEIYSTGIVLPKQDLDIFFINTESLVFLTISSVTLAVITILIGKSMAEDKNSKVGIFYYLAVYGFIVPSWLFMAVYNTIFSRKSSWR